MIFKKKKDMVDVRELQRRGVVKIPKKDVEVVTDKSGFVDLGKKDKINDNSRLFGFEKSSKKADFSTEDEGYSKREVDSKMVELDNKIYKLEQRIELLERKSGVSSQDNTGSLIGW